MNFKNKTIVVTGASSGLGKKLAIELSQHEANLVLTGRNLTALQQTATECSHATHIIPADLTSKKDCENLIKNTIARFDRLDYLVLNAGISMWATFEELENLNMIHQMIDNNFFGPVNCMYYALSHLKETAGMVVVISSVQGKFGVPYHTGYAASKHALHGFFDSLRMELQNDKVDVLIATPSWIRDTALKKNALKTLETIDPALSQKHHRHSLTVDICAKQIIKAMWHRKKEIMLPKYYQALLWLKLIAPGWLDFLIKQKTE